jgi:hypothetical protein
MSSFTRGFEELPKILSGNFVAAFFLPALLFQLWMLALVHSGHPFDVLTYLLGSDAAGPAAGSVVDRIASVAAVAGVIAVILAMSNRQIIRFLEGYGGLNPLRLFGSIERRRFKRLHARIKKLEVQRGELKSRLPRNHGQLGDLERRLGELHRLAAERFPADEEFVLPTALGNTIRAFEAYTYVVYNVDCIYVWNRLLACLPRDFREMIDAARSQLDFWVNMFVMASVSTGLCVGVGLFPDGLRQAGLSVPGSEKLAWFTFVSLLISFVALRSARLAALEWGDLFKAAFDLYHPTLAATLGYRLPADRKKQRRFWRGVNRVFIYRNPEAYAELSEFAAADEDAAPSPPEEKGAEQPRSRRA